MNNIVRLLVVVIIVSLMLPSCNQSNNKQKELDLQKKELDLKQKELDLKAQELSMQKAQTENIVGDDQSKSNKSDAKKETSINKDQSPSSNIQRYTGKFQGRNVILEIAAVGVYDCPRGGSGYKGMFKDGGLTYKVEGYSCGASITLDFKYNGNTLLTFVGDDDGSNLEGVLKSESETTKITFSLK